MTTVTETTAPAAVPPAPRFRHWARRVWAGVGGNSKVTAVAVVFLVLLIVACVAAPVLPFTAPGSQDLAHVLSGPSSSHLLGTDELGRDLLSRIFYGGRITLLGALEAVAVYVVLGVALGLLAGYFETIVGSIVVAVGDILFAVPALVMMLVVVAVFPTSELAVMSTLGILGAAGLQRVVRVLTLQTRNQLYLDAAKVSGLSDVRILARHVLPRLMAPVAVQAALFGGVALVTQCGLAFLGFLTTPTSPSWGAMVGEASGVLQRDPWFVVPTGAVIVLTTLALGIIGDAISYRAASMGKSQTQDGRESKRRRAARGVTPAAPALVDEAEVAGGDSPALLSVRDLAVAYQTPAGQALAVDGVSFDLPAGMTLGLVGESGCGKTTVLTALMGLLPGGAEMVEGEVRYSGEVVSSFTSQEWNALRGREIGYVSQEPMNSLDPCFTVGSLLTEALRHHHGMSRREAGTQAVSLLRSVRLPDPDAVMGRYVSQLSGGMAQRVGIALALAGNPRLLLADEPTSALDVTVRGEILALLKDLQRSRQMTVVIVTHDWTVVEQTCDVIAVMYAGEIVEQARTEECLAEPHHPYTRGLLDSVPSRAVPGQPIKVIPGRVPAPSERGEGCRFANRCSLRTPDCETQAIPLVRTVDGRRSRCIRVAELIGSREDDESVTTVA